MIQSKNNYAELKKLHIHFSSIFGEIIYKMHPSNKKFLQLWMWMEKVILRLITV